MLIAIGIYEYPVNDNEALADDLNNTVWHIDRNYELYQECNNPDEVFTYMNKYDKIESIQNTEDINMDI